MRFLRGLGKVLGSTIFSTLLVLAILSLDIVGFTSHDNLKSLVGGVLEKQLQSSVTEEELTTLHAAFVAQCSQATEVSVPLGDQDVTLKCSDIQSSDASGLIPLVSSKVFDTLYYKDFGCSFIECLRSGQSENLLVVASAEGNQFYRSFQLYLWIGAAAGLAILLVSTDTWVGRLKGVGWNMFFTGLPFLLVGFVQSAVTSSLTPELESTVAPIVDNLISSIKNKFIMVLVAGIVLLVAGYALGFYLSRKGKKK
jgi:hypothetical protein